MEVFPEGAAIHWGGGLKLCASVVTIGAFDGVHLAHQELVTQAVVAARKLGVPAVVHTFAPAPRHFFGTAEPLMDDAEKVRRLAALGADHVVVARFDEAYRRRPAAAFIADLEQLGACEVWVGADFRFGAQGAGNVAELTRHFRVQVLEEVRCPAGERISSTRIRALRREGRQQEADRLQGGMIACASEAPLNTASLCQMQDLQTTALSSRENHHA
ncbi:FAD synthetase [Xanthobacter sp. TB0139]|uniref:FAD synthetase n=1 Tax=Xanthobacter sp. TB0139 TaxID=3459178 RepID=UPI004039E1C0